MMKLIYFFALLLLLFSCTERKTDSPLDYHTANTYRDIPMREAHAREFISEVRVVDKDAIEPWPFGQAELKVEVLHRYGGHTYMDVIFVDADENTSSVELPADVMSWGEMGADSVLIVWTELDSNGSEPVEMNIEGFKFTAFRGKYDDPAGYQLIYRNEPNGKIYSTGIVQWKQTYRAPAEISE